jgi:hypothetical protein
VIYEAGQRSLSFNRRLGAVMRFAARILRCARLEFRPT